MQTSLDSNPFYEMYAAKYKLSTQECIAQIFNNDADAFVKEANWFIENGCGLNG